MRLQILFDVTVSDATDAWALAEKVFDFFASDPDDLFPEIETVEDYGVERLP
jgi:hypothetical protein